MFYLLGTLFGHQWLNLSFLIDVVHQMMPNVNLLMLNIGEAKKAGLTTHNSQPPATFKTRFEEEACSPNDLESLPDTFKTKKGGPLVSHTP